MPEGYPIVRRFVIRRFPLAIPSKSPWIIRDRARPAWLGGFASFDLAIAAAVDRILARESGRAL